jgi:hypothetical protein
MPQTFLQTLVFVILFFWGQSHSDRASYSQPFLFNAQKISIQDDILHLRLNKAEKQLDVLTKQTPNDPVLVILEDYAHFMASFLKIEDKNSYTEKTILERISKIKMADSKSPYYYFAQAEMLLHLALLNFEKESYLSGAINLKDAYSLLKKNTKLYPEFTPAYKSLGLIEMLAGAVPAKFSWIIATIGIKTDIDGGLQKLKKYTLKNDLKPEEKLWYPEGMLVYAAMLSWLKNDKEAAWNLVQNKTNDYSSNLLHCYIRASVAMDVKRNDEVLKILQSKPRDTDASQINALNYMMAKALLFKLNATAEDWFLTYIKNNKNGDLVKDSYLKISWLKTIENRNEERIRYHAKVIAEGNEKTYPDKTAVREAKEGVVHHPALLKARLYSDGGYYSEAWKCVELLKEENFTTLAQKTELYYRKGKILLDMEKPDKAEFFFVKALEKGAELTVYYAANAAILLGQIHENSKKFVEAKKYYQLSLNLPNKEYKNSLDQKAKAGLKRLEEIK